MRFPLGIISPTGGNICAMPLDLKHSTHNRNHEVSDEPECK